MKHKFIDYPKEYESVFCTEENFKKHDINFMTTEHPDGWEVYKASFKNFFKDLSNETFQQYIRYFWFQRKYAFKGISKKKYMGNGHSVMLSYSFFCRHYLGSNNSVFLKSFMFYKVLTFIIEWFPDIDDHDPAIEPEYYKWPFKNITIDFLTVVYQMPERMDILRLADERDLSYLEFLDYVVNYVYVFNERHKNNNIYSFVYKVLDSPPYVRYNTTRKNKIRNKNRKTPI